MSIIRKIDEKMDTIERRLSQEIDERLDLIESRLSDLEQARAATPAPPPKDAGPQPYETGGLID